MLDSYPCNMKHLLVVYGSRMSYIFNMIDFRLSPLLQDFPYFDICWTLCKSLDEKKHLLGVYGSRIAIYLTLLILG